MTDLIQILREEADRQEALFNEGEATTVGNGYQYMRYAAHKLESMQKEMRQALSDDHKVYSSRINQLEKDLDGCVKLIAKQETEIRRLKDE